MKAAVYHNYGAPDVVEVAEVEKPTPTADQILIKIHAASVNGSDKERLRGKPLYVRADGLLKPRHPILGSEIAGRVEAAGKNVTEFTPGDDVFGDLPGYRGGFAEYACTSGRTMAHKPAGLTFEEAASIPQAGAIAWHAIRKQGRVRPGQKLLINGAGGSVGSFAVQLARLDGAEVTGVDNAGKLDFMRSLGADHVVDYAREDFTRSGGQYDLLLDVVGNRSVFAIRRALAPGGAYFFVGGSTALLFQILLFGPLIRRAAGKRLRVLAVPQNRKDSLAVAELCESGEIVPVIDRRYPLSETLEALRYVAEGRAKGKVVISVA